MGNKLPQSSPLTINPGDEKIPVSISVADAKVVVQIVDRLFSMGGIRGEESLPIAIVRTKLVDIIKGDNNVS